MLGPRQVDSGEVAFGENHPFGAQPAEVFVAKVVTVEFSIGEFPVGNVRVHVLSSRSLTRAAHRSAVGRLVGRPTVLPDRAPVQVGAVGQLVGIGERFGQHPLVDHLAESASRAAGSGNAATPE